MPRQRSPESIKAEELYHSGMSLVDIAKKLNRPEGTVRRWKSTQKWGDERKTERSETKPSIRRGDRTDKTEAIAEEVDQVMNNPELTDKQRLFCLQYVRCFNATKAYQKAYGRAYNVANAEGYKLLVNPRVKAEIQRLKQNRLNREMLDESDIFQWYMDVAYADIKDYMEFGNEEIEVTDKHGNDIKIKISNVNIKNDTEVDGTLISEVSKGKDGVKVKLLDKMRAMNWIADHMELATEKQRAEITLIHSKINSEKEEDDGVEIINDVPQEEKSKDIRNSNTEIPDDIQQPEN